MRVQLREDYQVPAVEQTRQALREGARSVLISGPTGSGKTVMAAALMELIVAKGNRCNFIIDRVALADQTSATLDRYGLDHGIVQADHPRFAPQKPIQICSIHTLTKRGIWPDAQVDIIDEAHVLTSAMKRRIEARASTVIGLSATPFTRGLGRHFQRVVNVTTTRWLIEHGWLVPYEAYSCEEPDYDGVRQKADGELDDAQAAGRAIKIVGDVVRTYLERGEGRKFICSGHTIAHCEELAKGFLTAGVNVELYTAGQRREDREEVVQEFRQPTSSIRGLLTVSAASRGFDVADVGCIIIARHLRKSLAEHIQLLGRGLRISPDTGKKNLLILDHSGNYSRFWSQTEAFFDHGVGELDDGSCKSSEVRFDEEAKPRKCPKCSCVHKARPACPKCGFEYPKQTTVVHVDGELRRVNGGRRPTSAGAAGSDLWAQLCSYSASKFPGDAARAHKRAKAYFKHIVGDWPPNTLLFSAEPLEVSDAIRRRIHSAHIAWANSPRRAGA